jgi:hypothetical protein
VDSLKWPLKSARGFDVRLIRETPSVFDGSVGAARRIDNLPAFVDLLILSWHGLEATGRYDKGLRGSLSDAASPSTRRHMARAI